VGRMGQKANLLCKVREKRKCRKKQDEKGSERGEKVTIGEKRPEERGSVMSIKT